MREPMHWPLEYVPGRLRLRAKSCLFVGAGNDVGLCMARVFALEGCRIFIVDNDEEILRTTSDLIQEDGGLAGYRVGGIFDREELRHALLAASSLFPQPDILVDNRMISSARSEQGATLTNSGTIALEHYICRVFARRPSHMRLQDSSTGTPSDGIDRTTETIFSRILNRNGSFEDVRENSVSFRYTPRPGFAGSPAHEHPDAAANQAAMTLQIAYAALFLASDEASFLSGASLLVDDAEIESSTAS